MKNKWVLNGEGKVCSLDFKHLIECVVNDEEGKDVPCDETARMVCNRLNAPTWHKVEDVLPTEGKYVLLYDEKLKEFGYFIGYLYYDPHKIFKDIDGEEIGDQITHWTPLPEFKEDV